MRKLKLISNFVSYKVINYVLYFVYYKVINKKSNKYMKTQKKYTRVQHVIDKQTNRAAIVIAVCFVVAWCLDSVEQGAGTLPILIAVSYAGTTFYRGVKLLTHKSYTDDKRDL